MAEMQSVMTDDLFLRHVLSNLEKNYDNQVNLIERRVGATSNPLKIEEMRDEMCLRYERLMKSGYEPEFDVEEEQALYAGAQFKGKSYLCGKIGHKDANCRDRPRQGHPRFAGRGGRGFSPRVFGGSNHGRNSKRFNCTCNYCHKPGHKAIDCRLKKARESQGNNQDKAEVTLCAFDFNLEDEDWEVGTNFDMINGELAFMAEEDMELEFGYCVNCNGKGPLGTFCDRCVDSGCIYVA
jgi:hypothetical protein